MLSNKKLSNYNQLINNKNALMMLKGKSKHTNHSCPASTRNAKTTPTFRLKAAWLSGKAKRIDIGNNSSVQYHLSINRNVKLELFKQDKDGLGLELSMVSVGSIRKHCGVLPKWWCMWGRDTCQRVGKL